MYAKTVYVKTHQTVHFKYVHLLDVNYAYFFFFSGLLAYQRSRKIELTGAGLLLTRVSSVTWSCLFFATLWTAARQASLSITNSQSLLKHVHVSDALQPSHPLSSPSPPAFNLSQHQGLFQWVRWPKYWSFTFNISPSNESSGLISFGIDWFYLFAVQESSPTPQFKSIKSSALHTWELCPTLTSIHDYWKNHSFDFVGKGNVSAL